MPFFKLNKGKKDNTTQLENLKKEEYKENLKEVKDQFPVADTHGSTDRKSQKTVNDFVAKTKYRQQQGLKPTGPELVAFARYLGIDPVGNNDLMWIAEEALLAPLPMEWTEHFDSNDRVFYYHTVDQTSSWTHPMESMYRDTYKTIVSFRTSTDSPMMRKEKLDVLQKEIEEMDRQVRTEVTQWEEHIDNFGNPFYFNSNTQKSCWTDPRPALCHTLYIKMKMMTMLLPTVGSNDNMSQYSNGSSRNFNHLKYSNSNHPASPFNKEIRELNKRNELINQSNDKLVPLKNNGIEYRDDDDDDSGSDMKRKKKKKKKKNEGHTLYTSQSEPTGSFLLVNNMDEKYMDEHKYGRADIIDLYPEDQLRDAGRVRVKAGIRLAPINAQSPDRLNNSVSVPVMERRKLDTAELLT